MTGTKASTIAGYSAALLMALGALFFITYNLISNHRAFIPDAYQWYFLWSFKLWMLFLFTRSFIAKKWLFLISLSVFILITISGTTILAFQYKVGNLVILLSIIPALISLLALSFQNTLHLLFALFLMLEYTLVYMKAFNNLNSPLYFEALSSMILSVTLLLMMKKNVFFKKA